MTLFDRMRPPATVTSEARSQLENPNVPITAAQLAELLELSNVSPAGVAVTQERATCHSVLISCVKVLAEALAQLPLPVYRRKDGGGRARATEHPLYQLLHDRPNPEISAFYFRELLQAHLGIRGNAYAEIEYNNGGAVIGLWPLPPHRVQPVRVDGEKRYVVTLADGTQKTLASHQVMHIPGFGYDGLQGYSPVTILRHTLGLSIAAEEYGARFFGNGSRPGGIITRPKEAANWSKEARDRFKASWEVAHSGLTNSQRVAILEEGMQWQQIGLAPEDSQFLETRRYQVADVARWYRVPLHMIQELSSAPSRQTVEQQSLEFVTFTMGPWLARWEGVVNWDLFTESERGVYFAEFLTRQLLRGDSAARGAYFRQRFAIGTMSQNDIREEEGDDPIAGGDRYFLPMNMIPSDRLDGWLDAQAQKGVPSGSSGGAQNDPANGNELDTDPTAGGDPAGSEQD